MKIRIKFKKQGAVKFVGHLDIMRYFQKVMRRADVDIRYSEGFSPHQIMSFAAPLGVGLTSNGEYMDIEVNSTDNSKEMVKRLNDVNVEGITVLSYRKLPDSAKNAMSLVAAADYTMWFRDGYVPEDEDAFWNGLLEFLKQDSIPIIKKTKKGTKEMDLKPYIYRAFVEKAENNETRVCFQLSAGSAANVRPEQVIGAYYESLKEEYPPFAFQIQREEVYGDQGDENCHRFTALEDYGEEIE